MNQIKHFKEQSTERGISLDEYCLNDVSAHKATDEPP